MGGAFVVCQKISYMHYRQSSALALLIFLTTNKSPTYCFDIKATERSPYSIEFCGN